MKKIVLLIFLLPFLLQAEEKSSTYLKALFQADASSRYRAFAAPDLGWFTFSLDSLKLYKFNSCGQAEWSTKYAFPSLNYYGIDILKNAANGFSILLRASAPNGYYPLVITTDAMGSVIWSKSFEDAVYSEVPYSILQDNNSNLYLYGNLENISNNTVFNSLTKINTGGTVLWSKLYNHGGIWGGAIRTQDQGFLLRTGNILIKTDGAGNELWTTVINSATYQYHKAVEVADGYVLNGFNHGAGSGDTVGFFKVNKNGNLMWGGKKEIDFTGYPQELCSKYNGNIIFIHVKAQNGINYNTLTEFDKDLNLVNQTAINNPIPNAFFYPSDICFLADSNAVISGTFLDTYPAIVPHSGYIKTDLNQHFSCDTSLGVVSNLKPVSQNFISTGTTSRNLVSLDQFLVSEQGSDSSFFVCSSLQPLKLELGGDTNLCEGSTFVLKNKLKNEFDIFKWSTGESTTQINVTQSGKYWLRAINSCRRDSISDTLQIQFSTFPKPQLPIDTSICSIEPIVLNAHITGGKYLWNDGSTSATFNAYEPGVYAVNISYLNCTKFYETTITDCESLIMPNVITPNSDALNNAFLPIEMKGILTAQLKIFNRWGQEIYATSDILNRPWRGRTYSKDCSDGVYFWTLEYSNYQHQFKVQKGTVTLMRN